MYPSNIKKVVCIHEFRYNLKREGLQEYWDKKNRNIQSSTTPECEKRAEEV
jgi:hypothetical protein